MTILFWIVGLFIVGSIMAGLIGSVVEVSTIIKDVKNERNR